MKYQVVTSQFSDLKSPFPVSIFLKKHNLSVQAIFDTAINELKSNKEENKK